MKKASPKKSLTKREFASAMNYYAVSMGHAPVDVPEKRTIKRSPDAEPTEHQHQVKVIAWWSKWHERFGVPIFALYAVPNGGIRDVITASRLKAEGVRRGVPDLQLDVPRNGFHGLRIELKRKGGVVSPEQKETHQFLRDQGYAVVVAYGHEEAISAIKEYFGE